MKIIVTGSSGFIGGWVARLLKRNGHTVLGLDFREPRFADDVDTHYSCDILDLPRLKAIFAETSPAAVIHLAARVDLDEAKNLRGYAANIDGVKNLITTVRKTPSIQRALYTSSQLVCRIGYVPSSDTDYCPSTMYGESKVLTEQVVRQEAGGGVEWCLVRPTTVWGPYMSPHYQRLLALIRSRLYFHVGTSKLFKSYSYVENIAHQYSRLLEASASMINGRTFYLCDYNPLSLRDYADSLANHLHAPKIPSLPLPVAQTLAYCGDILNGLGISRFPFNSFRLKNITTEYIFDTTATEEICGALPHTMEDGIAQTAAWYLSELGKR